MNDIAARAAAWNFWLGFSLGFLGGCLWVVFGVAFVNWRRRVNRKYKRRANRLARNAMATANNTSNGMTTSSVNDDRKPWWDKFAVWAIQQGPAFVLLAAVLGCLGYAAIYVAPAQLQKIQDGYTAIADKYEKTIDKVVDKHERSLERIAETHDRDRDAWERAIRDADFRSKTATNK